MQDIIVATKDWGITADELKSRPELTILQQVKEHGETFVENGISQDVVNEVAEFKNTFLGIDLGQIPTISPETWDRGDIALIMIPIL